MPEPILNGSTTGLGGPKPRMWRNVLSNWGSFLYAAVVAFFLSPFVVRHLGDSAYGAWVLLGSLVGYMGLLGLGVRGAVTRYIAKYYAEGAHDESSRLATTAIVIYCGSGLAAVLVAVILAIVAVPAFHLPDNLVSEAQIVVILAGITLAMSLINGVFEGAIVGQQRFDITSAITIATESGRALLVVLVLSAGYGLVALALVNLGIALLRIVGTYAIERRLYPELRVARRYYDPQVIRLILSFSIYTIILQASDQIIMYTDSLVISSFLPVSRVTFYAIAANLTIYARSIVSGISFTFTPLTSALQTRGEDAELRRVVLKGARFATLAILPIIATFMLRGGSFIGLWMGPQYGAPSGAVLWILALALWTHGGYGILVSTMTGLNRHSGLVPFFLIEAAANLGLSIWLVQRMGIMGVAWGTAIPRLIIGLIGGPWYLRRTLGVGMSLFWLHAWIRPTLSITPFAVGTYLIERAWPAPNLVIFFVQVALVLPLAAIGGWLWCLTATEREAYRRALNQYIAQRRRRT